MGEDGPSLLDDRREFAKCWPRRFGPAGVGVVGHDTKELMRSLLPLGVDITTLAMDTAVAAYLLDPSTDGYRLGDLAARYLGVTVDDGTGGRARAPASLDDSPTGTTVDRTRDGSTAADRVPCVWRPSSPGCGHRCPRRWTAVAEDALYEDIEQPLVRVLARMEVVGIPVDREVLRPSPPALAEECASLGGDHAGAGRRRRSTSTRFPSFAPCSTRRLGLTPVRKTKTGFSTDARTLELLRGPAPDRRHAACATERSRSFAPPTARAWPPRWRPTAGSMPPSARRWPGPAGCPPTAPTCTTSRSGPRRGGGSARRSSPRPGRQLLVADYDQVELRAIAHLSRGPGPDRGVRRRGGHPPHGGARGCSGWTGTR